MNTHGREEIFHVREYAEVDRREFMWDEEVVPMERALLLRMDQLSPGDTLVVNFDGVSMSSDAARRLLKRTILRVQGGEWSDRAVVLDRLGRGRYNVKVMLQSEHLAVVARNEKGAATLLGDAEPAAIDTYELLAKRSSATARDVLKAFSLNTVAAATNRLARLAKIGAVRRVGQESVEGGGLQYRYAAVK
jgi:hypothetical protein